MLVPAPFPGERFLLRRDGVTLDIDSVRTRSGKWGPKGFLFVSNVRLVFMAEKPDESGLQGFDFPLVYIRKDVLNQPIFGCNNLSGEVWPAADGGGPAGLLPPHKFTVYFKTGGIGTFYPLYYTLSQRARQSFSALSGEPPAPQQQQQQPPMPGPLPAWKDPNPASWAESLVRAAYVDPSDPSTVYVSQPTGAEQTLATAPLYAANYGRDDGPYEDMVAGHGGQQGGAAVQR
ncbi:hypothetical protein FOA52_000171 [Chlamydomonas sp. UWO 241]|nr:hypothetical protein FOA52_000171 [Chlamydomonas sp. UWO 241]